MEDDSVNRYGGARSRDQMDLVSSACERPAFLAENPDVERPMHRRDVGDAHG